MTTNDATGPFDGWAMVELMGKRVRAGRCREVVMFGATLLRVEVPREEGSMFDFEFYGGSAIFGIHPCTEAQARRIAHEYRYAGPVQAYRGIDEQALLEFDEISDEEVEEHGGETPDDEAARCATEPEVNDMLRRQSDEDAAAEREFRPTRRPGLDQDEVVNTTIEAGAEEPPRRGAGRQREVADRFYREKGGG